MLCVTGRLTPILMWSMESQGGLREAVAWLIAYGTSGFVECIIILLYMKRCLGLQIATIIEVS